VFKYYSILLLSSLLATSLSSLLFYLNSLEPSCIFDSSSIYFLYDIDSKASEEIGELYFFLCLLLYYLIGYSFIFNGYVLVIAA
jgi:hypothetical protein